MDDLSLNSRAYFLGNGTPEFMMSGLEADTPMPVASLTKIMTAYAALEYNNLDDEVTITEEMLGGLDGFAVIGLKAGQVATVEDLLYATMLPSAGDAAQALAIHTAGSIEKFAERMNTLATNIGMENTHFSNPVGFDEDNYSTARDIALLIREVYTNRNLVTIFETYEKELSSIGKTALKTFPKTNYILGGKTGYTDAAGRCLASVAEIEGKQYVLVTLGAPTDGTGHLADAETVYKAVEERYEPVELVSAGDLLVRVGVEGSPTKTLEFRSTRDFIATLPNDFRAEDLTYRYEGHKDRTTVQRTTVADEPFGKLKIKYKGKELGGWQLVAQKSCEGIAEESYCVEMPRFYSYGWMLLGALVTVLLAGLTTRKFLQMRKARRLHKEGSKTQTPGSKVQKLMPWICLSMTLIGFAICGYVFWDCFSPAREIEILQPEIKTTVAEIDEKDESEKSKDADTEVSENREGEENELAAAPKVGNCTTEFGNLLLINPNFPVNESFINERWGQLISVSQTYGIREYHPQGNEDNLMIPEAAKHLDEMLAVYRAENPGHEMGTYSCFRARGTSCGRLCAATGTSDHHTGLTCDLIDLEYGSELNTDYYDEHKEWQWLRENSYKYGFIDRFPEAWAGGSMSEPLNVDGNGTTGLYETWHYRYVGKGAATDIALGKYNNGQYDSLEHYLKATGKVRDLKAGICM